MDAAEFATRSITNRSKGYSPGKLLFLCDMILPIKHKLDCKLTYHKKQTQINKDSICKNIKRG